MISTSTPNIYNRSLIAVSIAIFSVIIGYGLFIPFLPYYANILGATLGLQVGLMTSSFMLTNAIGAAPLGRFSDRFGRKLIISIGLFTYAISTLIFPFVSTWIHLVILRAIQGIGGAMIWPASRALIADITPPGSRGRALGFFNACFMLGLVIGPAIGGAIQFYGYEILNLSELESYKLPFYFGGVFSAIASVIAIKFIDEPGKPSFSPNSINSEKETGFIGLKKRFHTTFKLLLALRFSNGFALSFIQPLLAFYIHDVIGLERTDAVFWLASSFFISGLIAAIIQIPSGKLADERDRKSIIIVAILVSQIFTILIPLSKGVLLIVILVGLRSAASAFYRPSLESFEADLFPQRNRGKLTGITQTASNIGSVMGPLFGFLLYDFVDVRYPFYFSAMIFIISAIAFTLFAKNPVVDDEY